MSADAAQPLAQLARFGVVGVAATAVNVVVLWLLVHNLWLPPVPANVAAFVCAFPISFFGHRHWTFAAQASGADTRSSLVKFLSTALLGVCISTFVTWLLTDPLGLPPESAVLGTLFAIVVTFLFSKYWAFAARGPG